MSETKTNEKVTLKTKMKKIPLVGPFYRWFIFALGVFFIVLGLALIVLPGPLTIPPILLGLWILSTEFSFAEKFLDKAKIKGKEAIEHYKKHPVIDTTFTLAGLIGAAAAITMVIHHDLINKGLEITNIK